MRTKASEVRYNGVIITTMMIVTFWLALLLRICHSFVPTFAPPEKLPSLPRQQKRYHWQRQAYFTSRRMPSCGTTSSSMRIAAKEDVDPINMDTPHRKDNRRVIGVDGGYVRSMKSRQQQETYFENRNSSYGTTERRRQQQQQQRGRRLGVGGGGSGGRHDKKIPPTRFSQHQRFYRAIEIEQQLNQALDAATALTSSSPSGTSSLPTCLFPQTRECNAALATFGDHGDLLRALRLYFKMRQTSVVLQRRRMVKSNSNSNSNTECSEATQHLPIPTLVTYSTLMSRAISLGKPKVALRLWKIMEKEARYMKVDDQQYGIFPDVKSANILMNAYAKLNDLDSCEELMGQMLASSPSPSSSPSECLGTSNGQKISDNVPDLPSSIRPNLVTYNTLLDACHKTGELDRALYWKEQLDKEVDNYKASQYSRRKAGRRDYYNDSSHSPPRADARTYTTLIATVAPRAHFQRQQLSGGSYDPSLAFRLMEEMKGRGIRPNSLTYSALIDVCGRCRRPDLALQGLRWMLDDERRESKEGRHYQNQNLLKEYNDKAYERKSQHSAMGESKVGAWTSAINACGKAGRIDTALRLFFVSMPRFGVQPNIVTCGCLLDCLLRHGESRTADTIDVLRYMKKNDIPPSQVMYTSLMTYASRLADTEQIANESISLMSTRTSHDSNEKEEGNAKAVNVYSELLSSLLERKPDAMKNPEGAENENLFQVTLLFQDMKSSGVIPDLACYNVLLRSCARTGDIGRAMEVLSEMTDEDRDDIEPNDRTWRELLKCASTARRSDMVLRVWKMAIEHTGEQEKSKEKLNGQSSEKALTIRSTRTLSMKTLRAFLTALLRCAWNMRKSDRLTSSELYKLMIKCYHASLSRSSYMGMDVVEAAAFEHPHIAASFLQAVVTLESFVVEDNGNSINDESIQLRNLAKLMMKSDALSSPSTAEITGKNPHYRNAILIAKSWI